jgi:hypothetical protein
MAVDQLLCLHRRKEGARVREIFKERLRQDFFEAAFLVARLSGFPHRLEHAKNPRADRETVWPLPRHDAPHGRASRKRRADRLRSTASDLRPRSRTFTGAAFSFVTRVCQSWCEAPIPAPPLITTPPMPAAIKSRRTGGACMHLVAPAFTPAAATAAITCAISNLTFFVSGRAPYTKKRGCVSVNALLLRAHSDGSVRRS